MLIKSDVNYQKQVPFDIIIKLNHLPIENIETDMYTKNKMPNPKYKGNSLATLNHSDMLCFLLVLS